MKKHSALLAGVLLLSGYLLLVPFQSQLEINADSERDLLRAHGLVHQGLWPQAGPAVDYLPVTLGPGWYLAIAPVLLVSSHPLAVHSWHVLFVLLGLFGVYRILSPKQRWVALSTCLLLGTSQYLTQVMVRVWHNSLLPGLALLWFWCIWGALMSSSAKHRSWRLTGAWLLLLPMLQLHAVSLAYALPLVAISVQLYRRDRLAGGRAPALITGVIATGITLSLSYLLLTLDWDQVAALRTQRMSEGAEPTAFLAALITHLQSGWSNPSTHALGVWVLIAAVWGSVDTFRRPWGFRHWLVIQVVCGLGLAFLLAGLSVAPRYFNGSVPGIYLLAGYGALTLRDQWQPFITALILVLVLWGGWLHWPRAADQVDRTHAALSLVEQDTFLVTATDQYEVTFRDLQRRVHGPVFGPLSGIRYLAHAHGLPTETLSPKLAPDEDLFVAPAGFPQPSTALEMTEVDGGSFRTIQLVRHKRRIDAGTYEARVGQQRCPISLPYHWSHLTAQELAPFSMRPGLDLAHCVHQGSGSLPLVLSLRQIEGDGALFVFMEWFDLASRYADQAKVQATTAAGQPLEVQRIRNEMLKDVAVFRIELPSTENTAVLQLSPLQTLATLDIY